MRKLELYGEKRLDEVEPLRLRLKSHKRSGDTISLILVNEEGQALLGGHLLHIDLDIEGNLRITKADCVQPRKGLVLHEGCIVVGD